MTTKQVTEVCDIYRQILTNVGMVADDDGFVSTQMAGSEKHPTLVKGKRLVLPTNLQLRSGSSDKITIFHPLQENMARGESDVFLTFRNHFNKRLNFSFGYLMISLLNLAIETNKHSKLSPEQAEFLSITKEATDKTFKAFKDILEKMMVDVNEENFIHTYIKKGGVVDQKKHSRVCVVSFPFFESLSKEPETGKPITVLGVRLRKADRECLLGLTKFILPDIGTPQKYWGISNSLIAPTMDSLVRTMSIIGTRINDVALAYSDYIDDVEAIMYDLDFLKVFDDLDSLSTQIKSIPMQPGNEGAIPQKTQETPIATTPVIQSTTPPIGNIAPQQPQPVQVDSTPPWETTQQTPVATVPVPVPVPVVQQNPMWQHPQQAWQPVPQVQQAPAVVVTENGIDVNSFFRANPALAPQVLNTGFGGNAFAPMPQNHVPIFARGNGMMNNGMGNGFASPFNNSFGMNQGI